MNKPLATHVIDFGGQDVMGSEILDAATEQIRRMTLDESNRGVMQLVYLKSYRNYEGFIACLASIRRRQIDNDDQRTLYVLPRWEEPTLGFRPEERYESFSVMSGVQAGIDENPTFTQKTERVIEDVRFFAQKVGERLGVKSERLYAPAWACALCTATLTFRGDSSMNILSCATHGSMPPRYLTSR